MKEATLLRTASSVLRIRSYSDGEAKRTLCELIMELVESDEDLTDALDAIRSVIKGIEHSLDTLPQSNPLREVLRELEEIQHVRCRLHGS